MKEVAFTDRYWILDTGCWIISSAPRGNFRNIQNPESGIQDQLILPRVFITTAASSTAYFATTGEAGHDFTALTVRSDAGVQLNF
jgi:hypothetical protein